MGLNSRNLLLILAALAGVAAVLIFFAIYHNPNEEKYLREHVMIPPDQTGWRFQYVLGRLYGKDAEQLSFTDINDAIHDWTIEERGDPEIARRFAKKWPKIAFEVWQKDDVPLAMGQSGKLRGKAVGKSIDTYQKTTDPALKLDWKIENYASTQPAFCVQFVDPDKPETRSEPNPVLSASMPDANLRMLMPNQIWPERIGPLCEYGRVILISTVYKG